MDFFRANEGISLLETTVGLAVFCIVGVTLLTGLGVGIKSGGIQGDETAGRIIATSTLEYIKSQPFSDSAWAYTATSSARSSGQLPSWWDADNPRLLEADCSGYAIEVSAQDFDKDGDGTVEVPGEDDGIRKITVKVYDSSGKTVHSVENYKAIQ